ncbi:serine hydrolase [soil metagenome]
MLRFLTLSLLLLPISARADDPLKDLEPYVNKALKAHGVPGVGVAVIQDGKVILVRGYGVKAVGKDDPVTADTLFAIGSVTKSFTVATIAMLIDEKKMKWDDPLRKHLPTFKLSDRTLNDEVTLRDVLCHRVGLPRNDLVWYGAPFDRDAILDKLPLMKYEGKIRSEFVYNNILYLAAGQAAAAAGDKSWDRLIEQKIFKPLGMTTANTSIKAFTKDSDVATPHNKHLGKPVTIPWRNIDNAGPAGSINASAKDMAEYVKFHMAKSKVNGKRLIERETFDEIHKPTILLPKGPIEINPGARTRAYGLGWMVSDFHGHTWIEHGGNIDGMTASVMFLPEKKLGVVVLANLNGSLLPETLGMDILDRLLGEENVERAITFSLLSWAGEYGVQKATEPDESKHVKDTKPTFALKDYAGKYEHKLMAQLDVKFKDDKLSVKAFDRTFQLDHWHYDTFAATDPTHSMSRMLVTFEQNAEGKVSGLKFVEDEDVIERFKKAK